MGANNSSSEGIVQILKRVLEQCQNEPLLTASMLYDLECVLWREMKKIYGPDSPQMEHFDYRDLLPHMVRPEFSKKTDQYLRVIATLESMPENSVKRERIFIGHGHSAVWREFK